MPIILGLKLNGCHYLGRMTAYILTVLGVNAIIMGFFEVQMYFMSEPFQKETPRF